MAFLFRRGNKSEFNPNKLREGEMALILDEPALVFGFGDGDCQMLRFDESVTKETARNLIDKIVWFASRGESCLGCRYYKEAVKREAAKHGHQ